MWQHNGALGGATFNLAHNLGQILHRRPQKRFEEFDQRYLAGSGLPVIFESARISSQLLLDDLKRDRVFFRRRQSLQRARVMRTSGV